MAIIRVLTVQVLSLFAVAQAAQSLEDRMKYLKQVKDCIMLQGYTKKYENDARQILGTYLADDNTNVFNYPYDYLMAKKNWQLKPNGDRYQLINKVTGKCLQAGDTVITVECSDDEAQKWQLVWIENLEFLLENSLFGFLQLKEDSGQVCEGGFCTLVEMNKQRLDVSKTKAQQRSFIRCMTTDFSKKD
jgi:hypothetical protein